MSEIQERLVRPVSRSVIRDVFNEITSEEYYQVDGEEPHGRPGPRSSCRPSSSPYGILVDMLQVQQHRFDPEYQAAINAQKQAEADVQTLVEQQKNMEVQKQSELEGKRAEWNRQLEDALGEAGSTRNEADGYYQTKTNEAKALLAAGAGRGGGHSQGGRGAGQARRRRLRQDAGGEACSPRSACCSCRTRNVSTMDVNQMVDYLMARARENGTGAAAPAN